ncbi:MAG TPA: sigma 54-interacting transcriptional regulator [Blastocatellia bacterium]|nr:sigma 54-interacting transcriptional regulator [Blastocatellia bacterium]
MTPILIALTGELKGATVILSENEFCVGRAPSNQLCLGNDLVSRRHCLIRRVGNRFEIEDLSTNGTFVNGEPVKRRALEHLDQLAIGDSVFVLLLDEGETPPSAGHVQFSDARTAAGTATGRQQEEVLYLNPAQVEAALPPAATLAHDLNELLKISRTISAVHQPAALAQQLLDSIFEIVPAEKGALLRLSDVGEALVEEAIKHRPSASDSTIRVNRRLIQQIRYERRSLLFRDVAPPQAQLVAPLIANSEMLGAIYLTIDDQPDGFDDRHLDLVTAIAGLSAKALQNAWHTEWLEQEARRLGAELRSQHRIIGESPRIIEVYQHVAKAASSDATVLILGESGTGKELVARAIHDRGHRSGQRFMAINCAAIPETLLESELFGHESGAFTGAAKQLKKGKLEIAHGGTVFLDEIGEMPVSLQSKLLRVLPVDSEIKPEIERLGGTNPIQVDIRVIAATNRDLEAAVKAGAFREDLYYRLKVFPITLPPLRDRRKDIELLARHFARKYGEKRSPPVTLIAPDALACLNNYSWPGNIRELESALYYAVLHHDSGPAGTPEFIMPSDLPEEIRALAPLAGLPGLDINRVAKQAADEAKKRAIREAINQAIGNLTEAAALLGIKPPNLHRLINELGLRAEIKRLIPDPKMRDSSRK